MFQHTSVPLSTVRRTLPILLGLLLLLSAPRAHTTAAFIAGDDTKIGTGGG